MVKKLYLVLFFLSFFFINGFSQVACDLPETARYDTTIPCSQNCLPLSLPVPEIKATTDYRVISDKFLPYPYQCPADTELNNLYIDDKFSGIINMPFDFCFYGVTYNKVVIGSNGLVTFDIGNASCANAYVITAGQPLPQANGAQCGGIGTPYYPRACIMGAYYDIDPSASNAPSVGSRISYYFTGAAPYRKMVIVFNNVPLFSCNSAIAKQEIVLYESTGIIDVHIDNKPACSWNGGLAILGIQNWDRTQGVAAPGKNCSVWTASQETYRFIPSGAGASLFESVNLYEGNTLLQTGTVTSNSAGQLIATFANPLCFNADTAVYRVVTRYSSCASTGVVVNYETKVTIRHNTLLNVVATFAAGDCASGGNSIVTVTEPLGAGYEYSLDGGNVFQPSPVFNTPGGIYVLAVRHAARGCYGAIVMTIPVVQTIKFTAATAAAKCFGTATGQVIVTTQSGVAPFQYSGDGGTTYQSSDTLFLFAGTHTIRVKDVNGCIKDTVVTVSQPEDVTIATPVVNAAYCSGTPDGQIIVTAGGGIPPYQYSLINGTTNYQSSNTLFANVGSFTAYVKDANGCIDSVTNIAVPLNDTMRLAALPDTTVCIGSSITIIPNTNATRFTWSPNVAVSDTASGRPIFSPTDTTTYYLQARLGTLCSRTDTFDLNVWKRPIVDAGNDTTICYGTQARFNATAIRGNKFRWSPGVNMSNFTLPNPLVTGYIPITYTVEVTDPYGCNFKEYDTVRLTVRPKVRAFAGQDTTATLNQPVQLFGCCMDIYQWQPSSIFISDTARNPIGNFPPGTTQVIMTTTTPEGCEGRDTVIVKGYIGPTYYVPSGFTPNGDGRNDIFRPVPVGIVETYYFNVYNRYGQLVYTTKTFMDGWDGRWKGTVQPQGAFVWMVKGKGFDGKIVEMKGTVILMQ